MKETKTTNHGILQNGVINMEHENYQVESQRDLLNCVLMLKDVRAKSKFLVHRYLFKIVTTVRY